MMAVPSETAKRTHTRNESRSWRLSRGQRKLTLTLHVVFSCAWIGVEAVLLTLGIVGLTTDDPQVLHAAYIVIGLCATLFYAPFSLGSLVTGLILSFGTPWGILRHYWVVIKLLFTLALTAGGNLAVVQRMQDAASHAKAAPLATTSSAAAGDARFMIVSAMTVGLTLLLAATVLSVYKPWGRTSFARRPQSS